MSSRIAIVDPGSFVLPYDFQLVKALAQQGRAVDFYGSATRYNGEFLDAMPQLAGVTVHAKAISGTVASRWRGALAYVGLLSTLLLNARRYAVVNLQFSGFWPVEWLVFGLLRRQFVFTVHNAVPHGFSGLQHGPTRRLANLARSLVFVSQSTHDDFMRRYGDAYRHKASVLPHGLLPVSPQCEAVPYDESAKPRSLVFWSTVKPYKGVELFADLARSEEVRRRGLSLAVYGAWDPALHGLREDLSRLGVAVHDEYLDDARLLDLLSQDAVFLLPYQHASQSGALYSLLNHGRMFICTDTGDLGAFMRAHGLQGLLLKDRSAQSVVDCLDHIESHREVVVQAFREAQRAFAWPRLLRDHGSAYSWDGCRRVG